MSGEYNSLIPITYMVACVLITVIEIAVLYFRNNIKPSISSMFSNFSSCILCAGLIYLLTLVFPLMVGWGLVACLILSMISSCLSTLYNPFNEKNFDLSYYLNNSTALNESVADEKTSTTTETKK